jgi:hypothetical protein
MGQRAIIKTAVTLEASIDPFAAQLESKTLQNVLGRHTHDPPILTLRTRMGSRHHADLGIESRGSEGHNGLRSGTRNINHAFIAGAGVAGPKRARRRQP